MVFYLVLELAVVHNLVRIMTSSSPEGRARCRPRRRRRAGARVAWTAPQRAGHGEPTQLKWKPTFSVMPYGRAAAWSRPPGSGGSSLTEEELEVRADFARVGWPIIQRRRSRWYLPLAFDLCF
jgi:hypothetical protein